MSLIKRLIREEEGQGLTEYALILALVALAAVVVLGTMGDKIKQIFTNINTEFDAVGDEAVGGE